MLHELVDIVQAGLLLGLQVVMPLGPRHPLHLVTTAYTQRSAEAGNSPAGHSLITSEPDDGSGRTLGIFLVVAPISGYFAIDVALGSFVRNRRTGARSSNPR
ncbi:hypothetical protein [Steroidobacter denitrificans]|uniref:hypothetical protein n=1 Tax=Steroidobacter denitrificans TaxID=465721 RepID=UPI0012ECFAD1|nr:hypothetical protein [Steroidobacter denitrificans]